MYVIQGIRTDMYCRSISVGLDSLVVCLGSCMCRNQRTNVLDWYRSALLTDLDKYIRRECRTRLDRVNRFFCLDRRIRIFR